jgi:hypothetical protein
LCGSGHKTRSDNGLEHRLAEVVRCAIRFLVDFFFDNYDQEAQRRRNQLGFSGWADGDLVGVAVGEPDGDSVGAAVREPGASLGAAVGEASSTIAAIKHHQLETSCVLALSP